VIQKLGEQVRETRSTREADVKKERRQKADAKKLAEDLNQKLLKLEKDLNDVKQENERQARELKEKHQKIEELKKEGMALKEQVRKIQGADLKNKRRRRRNWPKSSRAKC